MTGEMVAKKRLSVRTTYIAGISLLSIVNKKNEANLLRYGVDACSCSSEPINPTRDASVPISRYF